LGWTEFIFKSLCYLQKYEIPNSFYNSITQYEDNNKKALALTPDIMKIIEN